MTELTRADSATEVSFGPTAPRGWTWQRCGRYKYRRYLTHLSNPDHLVPSAPAPTDMPPLRISERYAAGRRSAMGHAEPDKE